MRRSTAKFLAIAATAALGGCGFTPMGASGTNGSSGAANSTGTITGSGNSTGAGNNGGGGTNGGSSNPDANCGAITSEATMLPPDILIVQDKSGSMAESPDGSCMQNCGNNSKWTQVTTALNTVIGMTDTTVNWGLKFFSDNGTCGAAAAPGVGVKTGNANAISTLIGRTSPSGNTPTRAAIESGASYLMGLTDPNPKYLLLATDGLPNCPVGCETMSRPNTMCTMTDNPTEDQAVATAVANALAAGFPTFVVGVGMTGADATLNAVAQAGGVPQTGGSTSFYQVTDTASLVSVLNTILGKVATCTFSLPANPNANTSRDYIDVFGDGTKIAQDPTNGWDYTDANHNAIQLHGSTCDAVMNNTIMKVTITFRCILG
jgi:hypothetical protein